MSKHAHLRSLKEQMEDKGHASAPFHYGNIQKNVLIDDHLIQLRAYKIYEEKGGSDLDNWLEAEQILRNPTNLLATSDRTGSGGVV